jgi:light-regulated signal transduction histidine kinase (bacteriophytochrome)
MDNSTENEIERLQKALDRANSEFAEFVSMAAHNLRDSLRDVAANSQLMAETYAGRLDSDAGIFLGRIQEGAARMQSLLTDVVDYWAAGTAAREASRIDMEAVFYQALLCAEKQLAERCAIATHDPMPQVRGDFETLTKVLYHLIRNAVEYCDTSPPHVHISCRREGPEWIFAVHDDGTGIEPEFQGRLFGAFKRLHGKEHPGNGLGLAFCKTAIERYGGRMWMESAPGAGSTFYFTVEAAD